MGRECRQVDLDHPVEEGPRVGLDLLVGPQVMGDRLGGIGRVLPAGGPQVAGRGVVVGEQGGGGADLGPHIADGGLAGGRQAAGPWAQVFNNGPRAALHGEDPGHLEDHVLGRRPAGEFAGEVDADQLRPPHVEREAGHNVHRVRSAHPDGHHGQPTGIGGVAVGADHHPTREGVLLENDLVDDS